VEKTFYHRTHQDVRHGVFCTHHALQDVRHGVFCGRMFSPIGRNVQFVSDLFGVSLYNSKIDKTKCVIFYVSMIRLYAIR